MGKNHRKSVFYGVSGHPILASIDRKTIEKAISFEINALQACFSMFSMFFYVFSMGAGTIVEIEKAYKAFLFL